MKDVSYNEARCGRLESAPTRALKMLGPKAHGFESAATGSAGSRRGPPDLMDEAQIARRIEESLSSTTSSETVSGDVHNEAGIRAKSLVHQANEAMDLIVNDGTQAALTFDHVMALEAVMHVRGRPALRVESTSLEAINPVKHPDAEIWQDYWTQHRVAIFQTAQSTGAVMVKDNFSNRPPWVQGTAWLIAADKVITNRHVLFPPQGLRLARRISADRTRARLKSDVTVEVDFAFDNGLARQMRYSVTDVLYVSEDNDPVDVAILRVAPVSALAVPHEPLTLVATTVTTDTLNYIYVIGHPGRMPIVPQDVAAVFNNPDERKRVSFGEVLDSDPTRPHDLVYDASTIGGFSGGCVRDFTIKGVAALHYWGDSTAGNRAITAASLRAHPVNALL